tara:strand:- start:2371 stop:2649 length:279 start_codon:yes stop_codon:yes gene_type:complete
MNKLNFNVDNAGWWLDDEEEEVVLYNKSTHEEYRLDAELFKKELWTNKSLDPTEVDCLGERCILELEGDDYNIYDEWSIQEIAEVFYYKYKR